MLPLRRSGPAILVSVTARIEEGYAAFNRGELAAVLALLAENVEWHPVEEFPERQVLHGPAQVERHLRRLREAWEELAFEPIKLVEVPPHVIVAIHQRARGGASGIEVEGERAHAWTLKDDRAVRFESFRDFDEAVKATAALA